MVKKFRSKKKADSELIKIRKEYGGIKYNVYKIDKGMYIIGTYKEAMQKYREYNEYKIF